MARMVVTRTKPVRYPSGPEGKEYTQGQEFEVSSERDVKALGLVRAAQVVDDKKKGGKLAAKVLTAAAPTAKASAPMTTETASPVAPRRYNRRDMRAGE